MSLNLNCIFYLHIQNRDANLVLTSSKKKNNFRLLLLNWLRSIKLGICSSLISLNKEFSLSIDINSAVKLNATTSKSVIFSFLPTPDLYFNSHPNELTTSKTLK